MHYKLENQRHYIEAKLRGWAEGMRAAINERERLRSRRNLLTLVRRYPRWAQSIGFTESTVPACSEIRWVPNSGR